MRAINAYLNFNGNSEEAFMFYKSVFGGEFAMLQRYKEVPAEAGKFSSSDGEKIMHISLPLGKAGVLMATDSLESMGQKLIVWNNFSLSLVAENKEEVDRLHMKLSQGGVSTMTPGDTFWWAYFAMCTDKFGIHWMINYDYPRV